ncbi:MAG: very short patch repair endonuclease [Chloroflexi bacterium]|nr:very short patch repair endonuclease [Chloroflexota bacterium]
MPDTLSPSQRSYCMSRVKGKDTTPELLVRSALHGRGLRFRKHAKELPGKPDVVFPSSRLAVFIDGDFWHGYRFPLWRDDLSPFWQEKIGKTRERDQRNFRKLRRSGWRVIRVWEHDIERRPTAVVDRIATAVRQAAQTATSPFHLSPTRDTLKLD